MAVAKLAATPSRFTAHLRLVLPLASLTLPV